MSESAPIIASWPDHQRTPLRFCFVSDLHCFSARSMVHQHEWLINRVIQRSDVCVWGGDLFDFRWSQVGHEGESIDAALRWLQRYYERYPEKQFVFLNGNHDAHGRFRERLDEWSEGRERFRSGLDALVADDTLFLHGDVIEGTGSDQCFARYRRTWQDKPTAHPRASRLYDAAVSVRLHQAVAMTAHRRRRTCLRLDRWLHRQEAPWSDSIRRVVFGHTHRALNRFLFKGKEFYNAGAAIRHVNFQPIELMCFDEDQNGRPDGSL
ncbi:metallophosphoesterase [Roseimaritima sediminicola]|uniref:metallophosphoesterase n=1 Tax=Roseimaritima sediminicola TaxID=2662066 RepID=UPI00129855C9|nr:metallophosphoesterase [Roseimaritima sediminicola]